MSRIGGAGSSSSSCALGVAPGLCELSITSSSSGGYRSSALANLSPSSQPGSSIRSSSSNSAGFTSQEGGSSGSVAFGHAPGAVPPLMYVSASSSSSTSPPVSFVKDERGAGVAVVVVVVENGGEKDSDKRREAQQQQQQQQLFRNAAVAAGSATSNQVTPLEQSLPQQQQQQQQKKQQQEKESSSSALIIVSPSSKELPIGYVVGALLRDIALHHVTLNKFNSTLPASHVVKSLTVFESSVAPPLDIADYFHRLQHYLKAEDGVCIAILLLLRRYAKNARRAVTVYNVHRLVVSAMLVASKLYSDFFFCCQAVALVGGIPTKELARMEIHFLLAINWDGGVAGRYESARELVRAKAAVMLASPHQNLRAAMAPNEVSRAFSKLFPDSLIKSDILRQETHGAPVAGAASAAAAVAAVAAVAANNPASPLTAHIAAAAAAAAAASDGGHDTNGDDE